MPPTIWASTDQASQHHPDLPDFQAEPPVSVAKGKRQAAGPAPVHQLDTTSVSHWIPVYTTIGEALRQFPDVARVVIQALEREHPGLFAEDDQ